MSSSIEKRETTKKQTKHISKKAIILAVFSIVILWLVFDISGIGGNIRFYSKWIECGQKPVVAGITFGSFGPSYGPQYYKTPPNFSLVRLSPEQFCTPIEAERAGFSANKNSWDFPHLNAAGEKNPYLRSLDNTKPSQPN